jgi:CDGSH-type Zn-finger protein
MADETPNIAQKGPYQQTMTEGQRFFWCACGRSKNQPFCDGSHKGSTFTPVDFTQKKAGDVWLCGCKHTKNPPFCDGSHNKL